MEKCKRHVFFGAGLIACVAAAALLPVSVSALRLPDDEDGLAELLEAREIDTLQYEQLLVFYALPLSVPRGELVYLAQFFPDIAEAVPVSFEEISSYRPYGNREIQRFFNDYPALEGFEPILRFDAAAGSAEPNGEVAVGINRSSVEALRGHRMRFRRKGGVLSAEGTAAFSDTSARWRSRRVDVSYGGAGVHIGNFKQPMPGELAAGRFAPMESTDGKTDAAGWLYGGSGAWNGVSVDVKEIWGAPTIGAGAFCHLRPAEFGGGVWAGVNVGKSARAFAGFAGFRLGSARDAGTDGGAEEGSGAYGDDGGVIVDDVGSADGKSAAANEYYYALLYAEYGANGLRASAEAAAPLAEERLTAAMSLRLNYRVKGSSAEYHAVFYPADGAFPMSRLRKQILSEIGEKEPPSSMRKHALRMAVPFINDAVKLTPELDFTESGGVKRIHGAAEARARIGGASVAVKHAAKIFTAGTDSALHASGASINCQTPYPVEIRASFQSVYGYYKNPRHTYALEVPLAFIPGAVVSPYIRGKYVLINEYWLGVKSEFHLYRKTWTRAALEIPVNVKGAGNVYIKASSSYSF